MPVVTPGEKISPEELVKRFPAKFTPSILDAGVEELSARMLQTANLLDPYGGVGGVHRLAEVIPVTTCAVEIEPELAALHKRTLRGDSRFLPRLLPRIQRVLGGPDSRVNVIFTSPDYGNRLADQHLGSDDEKCRPCNGRGWVLKGGVVLPVGVEITASTVRANRRDVCSRCAGSGHARSDRQGYAVALGRKLTSGSGAAHAYGDKYKAIHRAVIAAAAEVLDDDGWWFMNVSSSIKAGEYVPVMEWWVEEIAKVARIEKIRAIGTPRSRKGANGDARVPAEHLIIAKAGA